MEIIFGLAAILGGGTLALWPQFFRKLSTFFDTLIHEAGHGLASLPFGAPLPAITVRKNSSGETLSSMGYLHQFLPFGLGNLTEKVARTISLMAGYSASIIFAALLVVIALRDEVTIEPWAVLFLAQVALATFLWTLVKITDSPWSFVVVGLGVTAIYWALFPWNWWIYGAALGAMALLFFLARSWLSSLAVLLTLGAPLPLLGSALLMDESYPFREILAPLTVRLSSELLSEIIFGALLVFLAFCCRSLLSIGLTFLIIGPIIGLLLIPGIGHSYVLLFVAGMLTVAGVRSLRELSRLTFTATAGHWQREQTATDMVFAAQELGGDPRYWYWTQVAVAFLGAVGILLLGVFVWV